MKKLKVKSQNSKLKFKTQKHFILTCSFTFLVFSFWFFSCGGESGPSQHDIDLIVERLAVTNSVEDAVETGLGIILDDFFPILSAYVQYYDSSPEPIPLSRSIDEGSYSASFTYEKTGDGTYGTIITVDSIIFNDAPVLAIVPGTIEYNNTVTNSSSNPVSAQFNGTVNLSNSTVDLTVTGSGVNFTVGGQLSGSVTSFDFGAIVMGDMEEVSYACKSNSQMTLPLSDGETVTCTLSEDCQRCD